MVGAVVAVLTIVAVLVWRTPERHTPTTASHDASPDFALPPSIEPPAGDDPAPVDAAGPSMALWRIIDEHAVGVKPPYPADWSEAGRALVDVSGAAGAANAWQAGDRVSMQFPQLGVSYEGGIERLDEGPGYSRSARGWALGADGRARRFVVTVGPTRVFAYIDTIEGPYELVADRRLGWLLPTSSMLAGIDFSKPDYIIPEQPSGQSAPVR